MHRRMCARNVEKICKTVGTTDAVGTDGRPCYGRALDKHFSGTDL
ncbi:hypothetical protein NQ318_002690 [Aromia moschata]|uniref:Uncharacterized protein n=1 Tax=Aromia moschata TaxID=1265417 RepID=A0AAV8Y305_9CUCU|nr:hypothetical protein NQ318_002690 [Aromia moschata]